MVVRTDLSPEQQLVQAVHAAHEAGIRFGDPSSISSVVVCSVPDERELLCVKERLDLREIRHHVFYEEDMDGQATALATEPVFGVRRKVLSHYPLWKGA